MRATPQIITSSLHLYFTGESLRNVQKFLRLQGVNINHNTVCRWIKKYVGLMEKYLEKIKPNVGNAWRTDELFLKIKGNMKYLYALMDDETRFWIAMIMVATLVLGTVAVSYEYAFAARPAAPPIPCGNTNVGTHNPHCGAPRPTP
jgi:hypothetical protein